MFIKTNVTIAADYVCQNKDRHKKIVMKVNPYSVPMLGYEKYHTAKILYCVIVDFEEFFETEDLSSAMLFYNNVK